MYIYHIPLAFLCSFGYETVDTCIIFFNTFFYSKSYYVYLCLSITFCCIRMSTTVLGALMKDNLDCSKVLTKMEMKGTTL